MSWSGPGRYGSEGKVGRTHGQLLSRDFWLHHDLNWLMLGVRDDRFLPLVGPRHPQENGKWKLAPGRPTFPTQKSWGLLESPSPDSLTPESTFLAATLIVFKWLTVARYFPPILRKDRTEEQAKVVQYYSPLWRSLHGCGFRSLCGCQIVTGGPCSQSSQDGGGPLLRWWQVSCSLTWGSWPHRFQGMESWAMR